MNKNKTGESKRFSIPWIDSLVKECESWIKFRSKQGISWDFEFFPRKKTRKGNDSQS